MSGEKEKVVSGDNYLERIKNIVANTRYGSVNLIIQDGKVIQIDKTEKIRL